MRPEHYEERQEPYEVIAELIIEGLQRGDCLWTKPWQAGELVMPVNAVTGAPYSGVNTIQLLAEGLADPRFCTSKQATDAGWRVREGEQSRSIIFWNNTKTQPLLDQEGNPVVDENGVPQVSTVELERPICHIVEVFHVSQMSGDIPIYAPENTHWEANERVETMLSNSGVNIYHDQRDRAFYSMQRDEIHLPPKENFADASLYYATALHELGHAAGHPKRLCRANGPFGSPAYAREELRAEIASLMLSASLGIGFTPDRHQAYINDWVEILQNNPYEVVRACRDAEHIKKYVMAWEKEQSLSLSTHMEHPRETDVAAIQSPEQGRHITTEKVYLAVPFAEKDQAKAVGGQWDRDKKCWYAPSGTDLTQLSRWMPERLPTLTEQSVLSPEMEFTTRLKSAGLLVDDVPIMDGKIHRVPIEERPHRKDGAYRGNLDGRPAGWFQNFVTGETGLWKYSGHTLTQEELTKIRAEAAQKSLKAKRERQEEHERTSKRSFAIWKSAPKWASTHPYLEKKGVKGYGIKVDAQNNLIIPLRDVNGHIHSLHTILPDGQKRFERGGQKAGHFHVIDPGKQFGTVPLLIAEGYATAATVHAVTGLPVVCVFDTSNILPVAQNLRAKYPDTPFVFMADNDLRIEGNPGITKAKLAADTVGGSVFAPAFSKEECAEKLSDWNDLYAKHGVAGVEQQLFAPGTNKEFGKPLYQASLPVCETEKEKIQPLAMAQGMER